MPASTRMLAVIDGEPLARAEVESGPAAISTRWFPLVPVLFIFTVTFGAVLKRMIGQLPGALVTGGPGRRRSPGS